MITPTEFGQALASGGAVQQPPLETLLQFTYVVADHGRCHATAFGGGGKTAALNNAHEHRHAGKSVHSIALLTSDRRNSLFICKPLLMKVKPRPHHNLFGAHS
ncbi:hypothetical protein D3C84_738760 [compost metagenome]